MQNTGQLTIQNIAQNRQGATDPLVNTSYRSRIQKQAHRLLAGQKTGRFLDNQQKRLLRRWQRLETQKRAAVEQGRAA
ncbi:hypothetical protein H6F86_00465 [Phormidium sp. FACHB-592]|uniref:Uncharacterized protein n=1 Tax=Stenomitos frigidus AS-A4 TaxID=2933935 RepID=A0ABV0KSX0_9CYAN|nr:hypothetical protein [Phormidium sp. FACHB-592]MBD2072407.1 hypothetical protein [Phormidium sp. FACHB-592]